MSGIPSLLPRAFPFHYRLTLTDPPPPSQGPGVRFPYSLGTLAEKRSHPYCQQVWATSFRQIFTYVHAIFHCQIFLSVCVGGVNLEELFIRLTSVPPLILAWLQSCFWQQHMRGFLALVASRITFMQQRWGEAVQWREENES